MPVIPSIQSLVGAHSAGGVNGASIAIDWPRNVCFESSTNSGFLAKYNLLTGLEVTYITLTSVGAIGGCVGLADNGNIFVPGPNALNNGSTLYMDGTALSVINSFSYPSPQFGGSGMTGIVAGTVQYLVDQGGLNTLQETSITTWLGAQDQVGNGGKRCAGVSGSGIVYVLSAAGGAQTGPITLSKLLFTALGGFISNTVIGTISMASIDPSWTSQFEVQGMCLDQTDSKILTVIQGVGGSNHAYLCKIDPATAGVDWNTVIPPAAGGGPVTVGNIFQFSSIKNQRVAFYTGASVPTVVIYNTATGALDSQYTSGLAGLFPYLGQAYSDTLGAICLIADFTQTTGSPTLLNSTPTSWSAGWALLYVAAGITPPPPTSPRRFLAVSGPIRKGKGPPTPPPTVTDITTEAGLLLTTEAGDNLITEN